MPFTLRNQGGGFTSGREVGVLVVEAVMQALHYPVAAVVRGVVMTVNHLRVQIEVQMQDARVIKRCELSVVTAKRFNDYLQHVQADQTWHPEVRKLLEENLLVDLVREMHRLRDQ
ncbi:hypothetical protein ACFFQW_48140 [Umezawaea endophytica]|uniref:Uncharacterized protein n=1 Tax=Umezawaea endophytica TaxID=1654476 RepID=A0A9X3AJ85_9PSEU|nr:hypothetical protein [Umezawaea endophytica]MCS7483676.1 hypothetical protein [Umezawaea endophytica]